MIDRLFFAALTFCLLAGGTAAVGSAMMDYDRQAAAVQVRNVPAAVPVARTERSQSPQDQVQ